jgi:hypothetical protein
MRKITVIALITLILEGCAHNAPLGNFANNPAAIDQIIADDAVKQIVALYPPAKTSFELDQPTSDAFGNSLVSGLRKQGFALMESHHDKAAISALPLRYVLDKTGGETNLYRLTVMVGDQSITRPYREQNSTVVPAGYWAHKE